MKNSIAFFLWTLVLICVPKTSFAHSVYIFAWADGPQVCTESYFTQKSKVRGGEVHMLDASGEILDTGFTGEDGLYCFAPPTKAQALVFEIHAGPGHKGTFTLEESDVAEAVEAFKATPPAKTTPPQPSLHQGEQGEQGPRDKSATDETISNDSASTETIRAIVRDKLQKQLSPMRHYLAEKLEDTTPGFKEIMGGIGWLMGLGALGFWFSQRRRG